MHSLIHYDCWFDLNPHPWNKQHDSNQRFKKSEEKQKQKKQKKTEQYSSCIYMKSCKSWETAGT